MDPLLRSQYDGHTILEAAFKRGINRHFAHEIFDDCIATPPDSIERRLSPRWVKSSPKKGWNLCFPTDVYPRSTILGLINQRCPRSSACRSPEARPRGRTRAGTSDLILKWTWKTWSQGELTLFRLSDKTRTVVFRVQTPALTYRLEPGENTGGLRSAPLAAEGDEDVLGKMSSLLKTARSGRPSTTTGDATVSVRLENGELLLGRKSTFEFGLNSVMASSHLTYVSYLFGSLGLVRGIRLLMEVFGGFAFLPPAIGLKW